MKQVHLDRFGREVTCTYRGETYRVRDNGAVFRRRRDRARLRPLDEKWTFGRARQEARIHVYFIHTGSPDRGDGFPRPTAVKGSCRRPH